MNDTLISSSARDGSAPRPLAAPASVLGALLVIVLLMTAAALVLWDFLVTIGLIQGTSWVQWGAEHLDGTKPAGWMVPAGAGAGLAGLWLLWRAVKPRAVRALPAAGRVLWVSPAVIAALAESVVGGTSGVTRVKARATRRKVKISAAVWGNPDPKLAETLRADVADKIDELEVQPSITVVLRQEDKSQ